MWPKNACSKRLLQKNVLIHIIFSKSVFKLCKSVDWYFGMFSLTLSGRVGSILVHVHLLNLRTLGQYEFISCRMTSHDFRTPWFTIHLLIKRHRSSIHLKSLYEINSKVKITVNFVRIINLSECDS